MAVIKEPWLCVKILLGGGRLQGCGGRVDLGARAAMRPFHSQPKEAKLTLQRATMQTGRCMHRQRRRARVQEGRSTVEIFK